MEKPEYLAKLPFEEAMKRLEAIVSQMEDGRLPLDEMIKCFECGDALTKVCGRKLEDFEKKIEVLVRDDGENGEWRDFHASSEREVAVKSPPPPPNSENLIEDSLF